MLHAQFLRHAAYPHLRASQDIDDQADADAGDQVNDADGQVLTSGVIDLHRLAGDAFSKAASVNPALDQYAYLPALARLETSNLWMLYQTTLRSTPFSKIAKTDGELDAIKASTVHKRRTQIYRYSTLSTLISSRNGIWATNPVASPAAPRVKSICKSNTLKKNSRSDAGNISALGICRTRARCANEAF